MRQWTGRWIIVLSGAELESLKLFYTISVSWQRCTFFIVVFRSHLEQKLSVSDSSEALCNFTITEHACSSVRLFCVSCESQLEMFLLLYFPPHKNPHTFMLWKTVLYFLSLIFQGWTSHNQQLGQSVELLTAKPQDIPGRGVEAFLPKGLSCTRPGSCGICHHGKCNPAISHNWHFPMGILCQNQNDLSNSRPKTTATHPRHTRLRLLENWESPTSATHNCKIIPLSASGSTQRSARFWPLHPPTSYTALAPRTSAAIHTRLCKQNM